MEFVLSSTWQVWPFATPIESRTLWLNIIILLLPIATGTYIYLYIYVSKEEWGCCDSDLPVLRSYRSDAKPECYVPVLVPYTVRTCSMCRMPVFGVSQNHLYKKIHFTDAPVGLIKKEQIRTSHTTKKVSKQKANRIQHPINVQYTTIDNGFILHHHHQVSTEMCTSHHGVVVDIPCHW